MRAWRFASVDRSGGSATVPGAPWRGPVTQAWKSSLSGAEFCAGVGAIQERIRAGDVYQVNLCRVLVAPLPGPAGREPDVRGLASRLAGGDLGRYLGAVHVPDDGGLPPVWVVTASPELFLRVADGHLSSGPIKGTAATPLGLTPKDEAENIMITDMVRNDLQRVCWPGTVEVVSLLELQEYAGLVHLVTTVRGELRAAPDWADILRATYPPASVSGAPKHTALQVISECEPAPRGPYCGAVGWIDSDAGRAELAVGIRTFWWTADSRHGGWLHFGTGAGITSGSNAAREWAETELKAERLVGLASGSD